MSEEPRRSRSKLERTLGQTIAEILHQIQKGGVLRFLNGTGVLVILLAFVVRFSRVEFMKEMGTEEFTFALGCGCALMIAGTLFQYAVLVLLAQRAK